MKGKNIMYTWFDLLVTLISSGVLFSLGTWLVNRKVNNTRQKKEIFDYYKSISEDLQTTLEKLQDENRKLYRVISRLERAMSMVSTCKHYADCPVRYELRKYEENDRKHQDNHRQRPTERSPTGDKHTDTAVEGGTEDTYTEPP